MIRTENWIPSAGLILEPNAGSAVRSQKGCIALLAGPGAGKTEVLAQRADYLLRTGACPYPKRILAISFKKDASENLKKRVSMRCGQQLASRFDSYTFHAFAKLIIDIFRTCLKGQDALDEDYIIAPDRISRKQITYDDMVPLANKIVGECILAQNSIRATYGDVFLDEFQDCTQAQYSLLLSIFKGTDTRIIAVGDTKQKIMRWAGALDKVYEIFGKDFQATSLNLYQNYRSQPRIRRVQNRMVQAIDPPAAVPEAQISGPEGIVAYVAFDNENNEAAWIVDQIVQWTNEGLPLSEIAILCNTQPHFYALKIMAMLKERGIPFRNEQAVQDLLSEPVFVLIVNFIILLTGDVEPDAWEGFNRVVGNNLHDEEVDVSARGWNEFIKQKKESVLVSKGFEPIWQSVEDMLQRLGVESIRIMSHDYENMLRYREVVAEVKKLIAKLFDTTEDFAGASKAFGKTDAVRIFTIHKCKGLEFHSVIVQGVENETFFGSSDDAQCAYFVAISRAKKRLVVTTSAFRSKPEGANRRWSESRTAHKQFLSYVLPEVGG